MTWQDLIVAAIVGASIAYLARRWYRVLAGKAGAGCGCSECPGKQSHSATPGEP